MTIKFKEFTVKIITSEDSEKPEENGKYFGVMVHPEETVEKNIVDLKGVTVHIPIVTTIEEQDPQESLGKLLTYLMENTEVSVPVWGMDTFDNVLGCKHVKLEDIEK